MATPMGLANGPYPLTQAGVEAAVAAGAYSGAYALGKMGQDGVFYTSYVGRSDDNIQGRLKDQAALPYPQFYFGYFPSAKAAYDHECWMYHTFNPLDNKVHPAKPKNSRETCFHCGC
jgi:hypothetical protein